MTMLTLSIFWSALGVVFWTLFVFFGARFEVVGQKIDASAVPASPSIARR